MKTFLGNIVVLMIVLGIVQGASAQPDQSLNIPEAEFGEIPDSLFSMKVYEPDPSAPYFYAFKKVDISFEEDEQSIIALLDYYVRIKVFDADAKEASIIAVPYYFKNKIEEVDNIRGYTYQTDGSKSALKEDQIRTINLNARYNVKEFTMTDVKDGSIIEYGYQIRRRYIEELPDFYLSHQAPTAIARATIEYPQYLRYDVVTTDFNGEVRHIEQRIDTSSVPKVFSIPRPEPLILDHWIARNAPAVEEEAFISSIDNYRGKLKFQLTEFGIPRQKLENSWELVVAQIRKSRNPWAIIAKNKKARNLGEQIASQFKNPEQAQDSVFRYLNETAKFNETSGAYSPVTDDSVLNGKLVDQPAINQTLIAMLDGAGIEAWPLLISTRRSGRINKSFPSYFQFNSQVVYSEINGKSYFMDASYPHSYPDLLPVASYNETGLILKKDSYIWTEIRPEDSIFAIDIKVNAALDRNGNLSGVISASHFGFPAQLMREKVAGGDDAEEIIRNALFSGYTDITLNNVAIQNLRQFRDTVKLSAGFTIKRYAASFTDGLEYRPMIVGYLMSNPFGNGERDLPVTLDAPEKLDLIYDIKIPKGFALGQGTQRHSIELPGAQLLEQYRVRQRLVHYEYHIDIARKQFEPELYPQLLDLYKRWVELSNMNWLLK